METVRLPPARVSLSPYQPLDAIYVRVTGTRFYRGHFMTLIGKTGLEDSSVDDLRLLETEATLSLEDSNPHDSNAVRVDVGGGCVGHLTRGDALTFRVTHVRDSPSSERWSCRAYLQIDKTQAPYECLVYLDFDFR